MHRVKHSPSPRLAKGQNFYGRLSAMSCFKTKLMRELAELAALADSDPAARAQQLQAFHEYAKLLFSGYGQTKVIEDIIGDLARP